MTIVFDGKERFGVNLKGPQVQGTEGQVKEYHRIVGCHIVAFTTEKRQPKCEGLMLDMSLVEINGKDVTGLSIDDVKALLQGRPIETRWILFALIKRCPDTPDVTF